MIFKLIFKNPIRYVAAGLGLMVLMVSQVIAAAEAVDDDSRPPEHYCPITLQVMQDPVVAADGHSYERTAINEHLRVSHTSPATGAALAHKNLVENYALKTMIREWKQRMQVSPSVLESRDANSIAHQVRQEFDKNAILLNSAKDQQIVAFLGNTGAGKSTLINLLAGKALKKSDDGDGYVLFDHEDKEAMVIGEGGNSETIYPKSINVNGILFFDLPGFNDTDGSERNLVNAAFTRQILLDAASVRLVFVAGQDQFTVDRSASVKQMFNCLKQLFIADQAVDLLDEGVFVATKVTCNEKTELTDFLVKKTDARDKAELNAQLKSWRARNKIGKMFHPSQDASNNGIREQILELIRDIRPSKIHGLNVSALYPPDTRGPLERMFTSVIEETLVRHLSAALTTLSDYDKAIAVFSSNTFWQDFDITVCREDVAIGLIKELCMTPYTQALRKIESAHEEERRAHIRGLIAKRQARVEYVESMIVNLTEKLLTRNFSDPLTIVPEYDRAIAFYTAETFWQGFTTAVSQDDEVMGWITELCHSPYDQAFSQIETAHEGKRQAHIRGLISKRRTRVENVEGIIVNLTEKLLTRKFSVPLTTLSEYDRAIAFYTAETFWQEFMTVVSRNQAMMKWITELCNVTDNHAFRTIETAHEGKRQEHIRRLIANKQTRVEYVEGIIVNLTGEILARKFSAPLTTLSEYDRAIASYTAETFWQEFTAAVSDDQEVMKWVMELCNSPYDQAFRKIESAHEEERQAHIRGLIANRQRRVEYVEGIIVNLTGETLTRKFSVPLTTLSEYDRVIASYTAETFWQEFTAAVSNDQGVMKWVMELCNSPYNQAFRKIESAHEEKRQAHIQGLIANRQARVEDIERRTEEKARQVIASLVPQEGNLPPFDFAYHKDFYDQVCGARYIEQLAIDAQEQEVVRAFYAGFISQHSHTQMLRWHQRFIGVDAQQLAAITRRLAALEERLAPAQRDEAKGLDVMLPAAIPIPPVVRGFEAIYQRFLNGVLVYRPNPGNDAGRINMRIRDLANPLDGTFDLSLFGDTDKYLSISTGYRKVVNPANANKVEIWIAPKFLIDKELATTAGHFKAISGKWADDAHAGIFWFLGSSKDLGWYDYLTNQNMENLSKIDLYKNWQKSTTAGVWLGWLGRVSDSVHNYGWEGVEWCSKISIVFGVS